MAPQVSDILVKLKLDGLEGINKLKNAFRALDNSLGPSEDSLQKIRQEIISYAREGGESIQVIKGQIEAFKGLQAQATINGKTFKALSKDIKEYEARLRSAEAQVDSFNKKIKSQAAVESQFEKLGVSGLQNQLAKRRDLLAQATPLTETYASALGDVIQFETVLTRLYERQAVIAAQAQTVKFTPARGGAGEFGIEELLAYANVFQQLPNTSAAYSQRLKELRQDLSNLDIGSEKYIGTLREMIRLQKEMSRAERIAQVEGQDFDLIGRQNRLEEAILRGRGRRGRLAGAVGESAAAYQADAAAFRAALQPSPQQVRDISSLYRQIGDIGMSRITANIEMMGNSYEEVASDIKKATAASNESISSLRNQRSAWASLRDVLNPASSAYRQVGKELDLIDKKLQKVEKGRKLSARGMVQAAGAAVSGGIFGGVEGFVGGTLGGIVGGVPGAFAGAALGAQVGMIRQQAAVVAQFAAELNLAKTTLAQASTGQEEYNKLLSSARKISSDYVVSLKSTIQGYAQVASAARANNLSFEETETIYRGVIAAGVAFGKSQQDLDAIITATVQVLSKGKLSAEELQGQIGERLPGAVAKFAEATNRTLPQLAKDLENGEVSIKDFVDYTRKQVQDYDQIARIIGESPEKAGARLQLALETAGENYGNFFLQIGAGFQNQITQIVSWVNTNQDEIKRLIATVVLAGKDIVDIVKKTADALAPVLKPVFEFIFNNIARGISAIRRLMLDSQNIAKAEINAQKQVELLYPDPIERALKGATAYKEALAVEMKSMSTDPRSYSDRADQLAKQLFKEYRPSAYGAPSTAIAGQTEPDKDKPDKAAEKAAREAEKARQEMLRQLKAAQDLNFAEKNKLDLLRQEEPFAKAFTEFAIRRAEIQRKYNDLLNASKSAEERAQLEQARGAAYKQSSLTLQKEINQLTEKAATPIVETVDKIRERIAYDQEYAKLLKEGINPELAQQLLEIKKAYEESVKALEPAVKAAEAAILRAEAEGASATEIKKYREELEKIQKLPGEKKKEGEDEAKRSAEEKERDRLAKEKAERLQNLYSDIVGTLEDGIVGSLMAGIDALITGTKTLGDALKEIASGILKDIGQTLLRFAVNLGMRAAFPGAFAAKGAYFSAGQADFAQNSIKPFATGGIVTRPTFFKYAKGGQMQNGLMGEAGPEAIMPLERGADGKLGVRAKIDSAMGRYQPVSSSAEAASREGTISAGDSTEISSPIDVRYTVERINSVDYVTAEEFRLGMRKAATEGAVQGERRAIKSLQNNRSTRGRLGMR